MQSVHQFNSMLLVAGGLLLLSILTSKVSTRFGIPALVLFIGVGMVAGAEGFGGILFDNYRLAYNLGVVALVLILFGGGLETNWSDIKPVAAPGFLLATVGVAVTAAVVGWIAYFFLGLPLLQALLLGAIVSSTDAAAVFGVLRAKRMQLKGKLMPLLELESGSNDPMAVFLTLGITGLIVGDLQSGWELAPALVIELLVGLTGGVLVGKAAGYIMNRIHLEYDGLYQALTVAVAFVSFGGISLVGGNGFLATYVTGVTLTGRRFVHKSSLIQFHEGIGWLMQIGMFLALGLLVTPSQLIPNSFENLLLALGLVFLGRPLAVFLSLLWVRQLHLRQKLFLSWGGLRGAVPIVLATVPLMQGVPNAQEIFNAVFFIVLISVLVQGTTVEWVARKLGVVQNRKVTVRERRVRASLFEVELPEDAAVVGKNIVELSLPGRAYVLLIKRRGKEILPRGSTLLEAHDILFVQCEPADHDGVKELLTGNALA